MQSWTPRAYFVISKSSWATGERRAFASFFPMRRVPAADRAPSDKASARDIVAQIWSNVMIDAAFARPTTALGGRVRRWEDMRLRLPLPARGWQSAEAPTTRPSGMVRNVPATTGFGMLHG